jgi:hypothetical protein
MLLPEIAEFLGCKTPDGWVQAALADLETLLAEGNSVAMWRVRLATRKIEVAALLADVSWQSTDLIQINKNYVDGYWTVALTAPLNNTALLKPFTVDGRYTLGIALHGAANQGACHCR